MNLIKASIILFLLSPSTIGFTQVSNNKSGNNLKLYWFIPDGVRAEPDIFTFYKWAEEGKLPNIKLMMDSGSYGYSLPVFPSHTPVNFATLLTGCYPEVHGIADGPMHIEGYELSTISAPGFRSLSRKVPAAWSLFESAGKKVTVITTPGSTPPETEDAIIIRGRWGGWGVDLQSVNYELKQSGNKKVKPGNNNKLFNVGAELTKYVDFNSNLKWKKAPTSFSPAFTTSLTSYGDTLYAYVYDSSNDNIANYNRICFSFDRSNIIADLSQGQWSGWENGSFIVSAKNFNSQLNINLIKLNNDGFFRIRILYNNLNKYITQPSEVADELTNNVGPLVAFVDNYPPQLTTCIEDKKTFLNEMKLSFDWHKRSVSFIHKQYHPDVVIHDCYNPNQMLTSRWWTGALDPTGINYKKYSQTDRDSLWKEVMGMYQQLDSIIGEAIKSYGDSAIIVFSSDHGVCVKNYSVLINNVLAKEGLLKFTMNDSTGVANVDWKNTKAIFLQMIGIYINPNGLEGNWHRSSGAAYDSLRNKVILLLESVKDTNGICPFSSITKWEDAGTMLHLPSDRVGDLVIANKPGYGWSEAMTNDLHFFETSVVTGYKQALMPEETKSLWTPFLIMGPGVKKGYKLKNNISNIDQLPTILELMNMPIPAYTSGKVIEEIILK